MTPIRSVALGAFAFVTLGASMCATPTPRVVTQEVQVPVAVSCVPANLRAAPDYPDTDDALKAAPGAADRMLMLGAGRQLRSQRLAELEPVVHGCR